MSVLKRVSRSFLEEEKPENHNHHHHHYHRHHNRFYRIKLLNNHRNDLDIEDHSSFLFFYDSFFFVLFL
jgi:hypothetical protein